MKHISRIAGVEYGADEKSDISLRVITDHIRSTSFMISDGVMPSNEGRGYVLRRLLRRAARHGRLLGINHPFLSDVVDTVIQENENAYPELREKSAMIKKVISFEEESFYKTIDKGFALLNNIIDRTDTKMLSGEDAFLLSDTFGFPIDLTKEILAEKGMSVDEDRFRALVLKQRETARASRKNAGADAWAGDADVLENLEKTAFVGYTKLETETNITALVKDGARVESAETGDDIVLTLAETPFYAESGGQVGDTGVIQTDSCTIQVLDTTKNVSGVYMHKAVVKEGFVRAGDTAHAAVDAERRFAIMRNHTAAHLLQAALRTVLGDHVEQAGQLVNEQAVRFDFTHFSALTDDELLAVEKLVNPRKHPGRMPRNADRGSEEAGRDGAVRRKVRGRSPRRFRRRLLEGILRWHAHGCHGEARPLQDCQRILRGGRRAPYRGRYRHKPALANLLDEPSAERYRAFHEGREPRRPAGPRRRARAGNQGEGQGNRFPARADCNNGSRHGSG